MASEQKITLDDVRAIADLAKLDLSDEEVVLYAEQLSHILESFELLQALNTDDVEPTASVLPVKSVMRADDVLPALSVSDAIKNAPDSDEGQFRVLPVMDGE